MQMKKSNKQIEKTVTQKWDPKQQYFVTIVPGKSIRIRCTYLNVMNPVPTDITFNVGDAAELDSYNLSYIGKITSITENTVTIESELKNRRLKLEEFCWRNYKFNLEETERKNADEMQYL